MGLTPYTAGSSLVQKEQPGGNSAHDLLCFPCERTYDPRTLMRTVLLIDDDPALRAFLSELLQREGWEVQQARNGQEGLHLANERPFEAVLCDLLMAPLNGFQVCRALREMGP